MTTLEEAPDLEDLAAYVDGRLSGASKARVEAHLLHDEDYYDVFMETVKFKEEQTLEAAPDEDKVVRWPGLRVIVPLVAAAMLVMALRHSMLSVTQRPGELVASLDPTAIVAVQGWEDAGWSNLRGGDPITADQALAYRLGVRSIDLRVALAAKDFKNALEFARTINSRMTSNTWLFPDGAPGYDALLDQLAVAFDHPDLADVETLLASAVAAEADLLLSPEDFSDVRPFIDMGRWVELGRLAALSREPSVLRDALRAAKTWHNSSINQQAQTLATLRKKKTLGPADFDQAFDTFSKINEILVETRGL